MSTEIVAEMMGASPELAYQIERTVIKWGIESTLEKAHFLGQTSVETAKFARLEESLNYSVEGLLSTFGRHRITEAQCRRYGRAPGQRADQQAIANIIYGGEWGARNLGNVLPGDGWRYRGRGLAHLTGRANYTTYGMEGDPDALGRPEMAADSAGWFWNWKGCGVYARADDIVGLTRVVNGGTNGLSDRRVEFAKAMGLFAQLTGSP